MGIRFKHPSQRLRQVQLPVIPLVGDWIKQHPGTISLGQGVVNYGPPIAARKAVEAFWDDPLNHGYHQVGGTEELRTHITEKLIRENGLTQQDERGLMVTAGGNMAFSHAIFSISNPGDEVILPVPFYFNHEMAIGMAGCKAIPVHTDNQYQLRLNELEAAITEKTCAIVTVSPNNPSGVVYPESDLRAVNELCRRYGLYHIHDEAYEYFTYDQFSAFSPLAITEGARHTFSLFSLSKAYGFASWRIGYVVYPNHLEEAMRKIQDTHLICPPLISQHAASATLTIGRSYCQEKLHEIEKNRKIFLEGLENIRSFCEFPESKGALYFLLKLDSRQNPLDLTRSLIQDFGVAAIPGSTFGLDKGCYLRISYGALTEEQSIEGIRRLTHGLEQLISSHGR